MQQYCLLDYTQSNYIYHEKLSGENKYLACKLIFMRNSLSVGLHAQFESGDILSHRDSRFILDNDLIMKVILRQYKIWNV